MLTFNVIQVVICAAHSKDPRKLYYITRRHQLTSSATATGCSVNLIIIYRLDLYLCNYWPIGDHLTIHQDPSWSILGPLIVIFVAMSFALKLLYNLCMYSMYVHLLSFDEFVTNSLFDRLAYQIILFTIWKRMQILLICTRRECVLSCRRQQWIKVLSRTEWIEHVLIGPIWYLE